MHNADETITIYNAYIDEAKGYDLYSRTVLEGVSWFGKTKTTVAGDGGLLAANEFNLRIPEELCSGYVDPKVFTGTVGTWTLQSGDIILKGSASEVNPRPSDLKEKYSDILTVVGVTDNRKGREPHFKVVGK